MDVGDGAFYLYSSKIAALSIGDGGIIGLDFTKLPICVTEENSRIVTLVGKPLSMWTGYDVKIQLEEDNGGLPMNVIHFHFHHECPVLLTGWCLFLLFAQL